MNLPIQSGRTEKAIHSINQSQKGVQRAAPFGPGRAGQSPGDSRINAPAKGKTKQTVKERLSRDKSKKKLKYAASEPHFSPKP